MNGFSPRAPAPEACYRVTITGRLVILCGTGGGTDAHADHRPLACSTTLSTFGASSGTSRRPSLFKLIRGIVRLTDSQRHGRAQHMKSYGQIIEISC